MHLPLLPAEPPLDPSPGRARELLRRELEDPAYRDEGLWERFLDWLAGIFTGTQAPAAPPFLLAVVLGALLLVAAFLIARRVRPERGRRGARGATVFDDVLLTAADHRKRAAAAERAPDWDLVAVESFRAMTADAAQRTLLDLTPGMTATEVERSLGAAFPAERAALENAADTFNRVRYGAEHIDESAARQVADLDTRLTKERPVLDADTSTSGMPS